MFFKDVIGQDGVKNRLITAVKEERISHALLFSGAEGTGKLAMSIAYAQYISCTNRTDTDSCGVCPSCHKYQNLVHPDLHFVFPIFNTPKIKKAVSDDFLFQWREMVEKSPYFNLGQWLTFINAEKTQGGIFERESESIIRKLNLKSFESEYKIMIIWLPEKMHTACSNKLLKLIEEPPNKTLFILITENEEAVIGTVRSRTQLIHFPFIDNESIRNALYKIGDVNEALIPDAVHLANGNYLKALEYLSPGEEEQFYFLKFQEMMRFAYKREVLEQIKWAEEMAAFNREKQKAFLNFSLRLIREYFVLNMKQSSIVYLSKPEKEWGARFAPFINERNISQFFKEFELAIKHISMNGNQKIIFLDLALRMVRLIKR